MERTYITALEFRDFSRNQDKLIGVLNHSMTKITVDVNWLKKLVGWQVGVLCAIAVTIFCGFLKLVFF